MKLSIASLGAEPGTRFLEQVKLAELLGFHAFFHNDKKWARDVFARLGAATQCTTRLGLGTSVIDPYTRHAALLAQATATLAEMAPGRFRVIMGSGSHFETLAGLRQPQAGRRLARGHRADATAVARREGHDRRRSGEIQERRARLEADRRFRSSISPAAGRRSSSSPDEVADGVLVGSFATPTGIDYAKEHIQLGLEASKRDWKRHPAVRLALCFGAGARGRSDPGRHPPRRELRVLDQPQGAAAGWPTSSRPTSPPEFRTFVREAPHEWSRAGHGRVAPAHPARNHRQPRAGRHCAADGYATQGARRRRRAGNRDLAVPGRGPGHRGLHVQRSPRTCCRISPSGRHGRPERRTAATMPVTLHTFPTSRGCGRATISPRR